MFKLLIISDVFFPDTIGGAGRVAYHLSLEICRKGHTVHIVTRNPETKIDQFEALNENFHIYRFGTPTHGSIKLFFSEVLNSYRLSKQLKHKTKYDLICIHQCLAAIGPYLAGLFNTTPSTYFFHSPWHQEYLIKKQNRSGNYQIRTKSIAFLMLRIENFMLSKCLFGFVLSNYMLNNCYKSHLRNNIPVTILPGGVDLDYFRLPSVGANFIKNDLGIPLNKQIFFTIRNLAHRMGIETLIEAFNQSSILRNNSMLFIGGLGPLENKLKTMVEIYQLKEIVYFLGRVSEEKLPSYYHAADFFILPTSELEGFGLVILEAMACGTPVFGTPVGAIPEILNRFDKRLVFNGAGWRDIKEKLEEVIEHPERYHFAPERCREFVEKNYSWKKMADAFEEEAFRLIDRR